jgi:hypothetical protein
MTQNPEYPANLPAHKVAPDVSALLAAKDPIAAMDPELALQKLILEKQQLATQLTQERNLNDVLRQDNSDLKEENKRLEPYMDIINDPRENMQIFLRDKTLITVLRAKARKIYGKMADLNSPSESGRKMARRTIDHIVEVALREVVIPQWHLIAPRLEKERHGEQS